MNYFPVNLPRYLLGRYCTIIPQAGTRVLWNINIKLYLDICEEVIEWLKIFSYSFSSSSMNPRLYLGSRLEPP